MITKFKIFESKFLASYRDILDEPNDSDKFYQNIKVSDIFLKKDESEIAVALYLDEIIKNEIYGDSVAVFYFELNRIHQARLEKEYWDKFTIEDFYKKEKKFTIGLIKEMLSWEFYSEAQEALRYKEYVEGIKNVVNIWLSKVPEIEIELETGKYNL